MLFQIDAEYRTISLTHIARQWSGKDRIDSLRPGETALRTEWFDIRVRTNVGDYNVCFPVEVAKGCIQTIITTATGSRLIMACNALRSLSDVCVA